MHGEREMPELRSGVRQARLKSKRETELQVDNLPPPTNNRRRGGGTGRGRGRGRGTQAKGTPAQQAAPVRQKGATGRGRAIPVIDLESDKNLEAVPVAADGVAGKPVGMEGGSGAKVVAGEEEGSAPPVPDRVYFYILHFSLN